MKVMGRMLLPYLNKLNRIFSRVMRKEHSSCTWTANVDTKSTDQPGIGAQTDMRLLRPHM